MPTPTAPIVRAMHHARRTVLYKRRAETERAARDRAILDTLAEGMTASEIARACGLTEGTIRKVRDHA